MILCVVSMEGSGATSIPPQHDFLYNPSSFFKRFSSHWDQRQWLQVRQLTPYPLSPPKRQSCYRLPSASTPSVRCCKQTILVPQVLATICLSEARNTSWIQSPCFLCAPGCDTKTERCIIHAINNNSLMLWAIFTPAPDLCLYNV